MLNYWLILLIQSLTLVLFPCIYCLVSPFSCCVWRWKCTRQSCKSCATRESGVCLGTLAWKMVQITYVRLLFMSIVSPSRPVPLVPLKKLTTKLPCLLSSASLLVLHKFPFLGSVCFLGKLPSLVFSSCSGWWSWGWELWFCEVSYVFDSLNCL